MPQVTKGHVIDVGTRMLAVLCVAHDHASDVLAVEQPFTVPLIDPETGEVLDRDLVGSLDRLEKDPEGHLVVVDLKTAARRYNDLMVETCASAGPLAHLCGDRPALRCETK